MSNYKANKADAVTYTTKPTKTDQSQASATDINIIVTHFLKTGQAPQTANPIYGDFTQLPEDLRGFIEMGRSIKKHQADLPEPLRGIPVHELVGMTNAQINAILKPPAPTPEKPKDESK